MFVKRVRMSCYINGTLARQAADFSRYVKSQKLEKQSDAYRKQTSPAQAHSMKRTNRSCKVSKSVCFLNGRADALFQMKGNSPHPSTNFEVTMRRS